VCIVVSVSCVFASEERRTAGNYCASPLFRRHSVTSTVTPVGAGKEIEYFFASDARLILGFDIVSCSTCAAKVVFVKKCYCIFSRFQAVSFLSYV